MDLSALRAMGALKDRALVQRTVTVKHLPLLPESEWPDPAVPAYGSEEVGHSFDIYVRKLSSADSMEMSRIEPRLLGHYLVMRCVLNDRGEQVFPAIEDALALEEWMLFPLFDAASSVNPTGPKSSPPKTRPGVTSRSPSGGTRSGNGRKRSTRKSGVSGNSTGSSTAR